MRLRMVPSGFAFVSPILDALGTALMAITARPVAKHDLNLICEHRERMFAESGRAREALRPMTSAFEQWLSPRLEDGSYFGWMLEDAGVVVAGLGMMVIDWPPHPSHPADHRRAYILNVFVEPEHRRKGLAKRLMVLAEERARELGVRYAILHSTRGEAALRRPRLGADERDGDPLGIGESSVTVRRMGRAKRNPSPLLTEHRLMGIASLHPSYGLPPQRHPIDRGRTGCREQPVRLH